jgi:hypothetical protein
MYVLTAGADYCAAMLDQALKDIAPDRRASDLVVILKSFSDPGGPVRLHHRRTV